MNDLDRFFDSSEPHEPQPVTPQPLTVTHLQIHKFYSAGTIIADADFLLGAALHNGVCVPYATGTIDYTCVRELALASFRTILSLISILLATPMLRPVATACLSDLSSQLSAFMLRLRDAEDGDVHDNV